MIHQSQDQTFKLEVTMKEKNLLRKWIGWLLSIVAFILIVDIIYENIKEKNNTNSYVSNYKNTKDKKSEVGTNLRDPIKHVGSNAYKQRTNNEKSTQTLKPEDKQIDIKQAESVLAENEIQTSQAIKVKTEKNFIYKYYSPLFKRLNFSPEDEGDFMKLFIGAPSPFSDIEEEVREGSKSKDEIQRELKKLEDLAYERDKNLQDLLGDEKYQELNQWINYMGPLDADPIGELEQLLDTANKLSKEQGENLIASMAEVFDEFNKNFLPDVKGPPAFRVGIRDEAVVMTINDHLDYFQERYLDCARAILSDSQMKDFEEIIKEKVDDRKNFTEQRLDVIKDLPGYDIKIKK
jgi:hypothetical protein